MGDSTGSKRHHWWPECVSRRWADETGGVTRLSPDEKTLTGKPSGFGVIGHGHTIKLGPPGQGTGWDQNFEDEFRNADDRFPYVIDWLENLDFVANSNKPRRQRFVPQPASEKQFGDMVESVVSLAVRSPMTRHCAVSVAERLRGPLPTRERNSLIGLNMRYMHRDAVRSFGSRGKAAAIYSPDREFIFGDGFFHNLVTNMPPHEPRILAPLTPRLALLYAIPMRYMTEPRLSTLVIGAGETDALNDAVQVHACDMVFYRNEKPVLTDVFRSGKHLRYADAKNVPAMMVHDMPGVPARDTSLDFLERGILAPRG